MTSAAHVGFVRVVIDTDQVIKVAPTEPTRSHGSSDTCSFPVELLQSNLNPFNYSVSLIWGENTRPVAPAHFDVWEKRSKEHICTKKKRGNNRKLENTPQWRHSPNIIRVNKRRIKIGGTFSTWDKRIRKCQTTDGNKTLREGRLG